MSSGCFFNVLCQKQKKMQKKRKRRTIDFIFDVTTYLTYKIRVDLPYITHIIVVVLKVI